MVEEKTGVKVSQQRLIYKARALKDEQKLSDSITENEQTIHLIARPEQSESQPQPQSQSQPQSQPAPPPNPQGTQDIFGQLPNMFSRMFEQILPQAQAVTAQIFAGMPQSSLGTFNMQAFTAPNVPQPPPQEPIRPSPPVNIPPPAPVPPSNIHVVILLEM